MAIGSANLDVNGIVSQLMSIEQRPLAALNKKEGDYQAKISAYGNISSALASFQTAVQDLSKPDKFKTIKVTSSDATALTASASDKASTGTHTVAVTSVAQAQRLIARGQTSDTSNIGSGLPSKLTFDFGSIKGGKLEGGKYQDAGFTSNGLGIKTITIDAGNNTLQGIRDAINSAKIGIKASIVNDGSENPYTLSLSPENIGVSNSLKISVEGEEAIAELLASDPAGTQKLTQTVAAQNAVFTVDDVSVSKAENDISDVIPGVSLSLKTITDKPASLIVAHDGSSITALVQGFVKAYNDLNKTLQELTSYNPATKQGAILQGDSTLRLLQSQIRSVLNTPIKNTGGALNTLSQIGISIQKDGSMALDTSKLGDAINNNANDVASLFTTVGKTSDPLIAYSTAANNTDAGTYPLNISKLATQGSLGGCEEIESLNIETGYNDTLNVKINGIGATVVLPAGTYTFDGLANELQARINGAAIYSEAGISVSAKHDKFGLIVTSNAYGSKSSVDVTGSGALNLFGKTPVRITGTDVEGSINGTPAEGSGQTLISKDGVASGIKVEVKGGVTGDRGKLNYSQGYAHILNTLITADLAKDGPLESRKSGINSSIKDIDTRRDTLQQRLPLQEARYRKQYSTLETMLSNMSKTSSYLTQQLSSLPRPY